MLYTLRIANGKIKQAGVSAHVRVPCTVWLSICNVADGTFLTSCNRHYSINLL